MSRLAISMLISAEFATANIEMNGRMSPIGRPGAPALTTSTSGVSDSARGADRHQCDRCNGDQDVDDAGDGQAGEHHLRKDPHRILGLLCHVHRVLEAHHRKEGQRGRRRDCQEKPLVVWCLESDHPGEVGISAEERANIPTIITSSSPESSIRVSTTLALTLSPTSRKLTNATRVMKPSAISTMPQLPSSSPKPSTMFEAKALDAVEAEVIPEHMTTKSTRNVKKWIPKALCVYSAAPAACGYLVTSSR